MQSFSPPPNSDVANSDVPHSNLQNSNLPSCGVPNSDVSTGEAANGQIAVGKRLSPEIAHQHLAQVEMEINRLHRTIRLTIQVQLASLQGCTMGSTVENQELAGAIHRMLDNHGLRICCPECGHPAIMRVSPRPGSKQGVFVFDHTIEGHRTFHGGRGTMPEIKLVAKPVRKPTKIERSTTKALKKNA
jgi:hypothetical protein